MSLMGIDIGTTVVKAIVFSEDGKIIASDHLEYNLIFPKSGWVEFDTKEQWKKIFKVFKKINSEPGVKKDPITALSVSTFAEGFTPISENGEILYNTIYSTDTRSIKELEFVLAKHDREKLFQITGYCPGYMCPLNKILWLKNNKSEIYKKTKKILFTEDLLWYKLGIEQPSINYSLASRTLFFDIRKKIWADDILSEFDIDKNLFSKPAPSGMVIGIVGKKISEELGFKEKVYIVTGCHDQTSAALGVGAIEEGIAADGMGTAECVTICVDKVLTNNSMLKNNYSLQAHAIENKYATLAFNSSSGSVVKWFRDNIADGKNDTIRKISSNLIYEPSRLLTLPYFSATGTPHLDPIAKGSIIGLDLDTTKEDIFKGIIEGLVFEICLNLELLKKSGIRIQELRASGGGSKSDYELNLKSSIANKPILRMNIDEAGCLGTMMLAGMGTKKFTYSEAVSKFVKIKEIFNPDIKIKEKYMEKYEKYKEIYVQVSQLYN